MHKVLITIILLGLTSILCSGQAFLGEYPTLSKKNLPAFFEDWKTASDSIAAMPANANSVISDILSQELPALNNQDGMTPPQFRVVPQKIKAERFELDTTAVSIYNQSYNDVLNDFPYSYTDLAKNRYDIDSIIPPLPRNGLYLTEGIKMKLSQYAGGIENASREISEINKANTKALDKFIPAAYGHWGGYWHFCSFPEIYRIAISADLIVVMRRTSWCSGDEIWYIKEDERYVKSGRPRCRWIE